MLATRRLASQGKERALNPHLRPVESATITVLADNVADQTLKDEGPARRSKSVEIDPSAVDAPLIEGGRTRPALQAQHGFAALVSVRSEGRTGQVLFDTGISVGGVAHNMDVLGLSSSDIEAIVFSHGHYDHTVGLSGLLERLGRRNLPVVVHPHFWRRRRITMPGARPYELPTTSESAVSEAGFEIVEESGYSLLLDGTLLVTGEVPRTTEFEKGMPAHEAWEGDRWQPDPLILDDQSLVLNVRGKGIVILTGCSHAGAINIVRYAQQLSGEDRVHMIIGGLHLGGTVPDAVMAETVPALKEIAPRWLVPTHCTGWRAIHALAAEMPGAFLQNSVGTRYEL
ncbi:MAG: MBL fold metallo-hydrolase [Chloroflexi bacterium]|nr:MBL fold metallo-hydrolase [Chloroflexota bacterium]